MLKICLVTSQAFFHQGSYKYMLKICWENLLIFCVMLKVNFVSPRTQTATSIRQLCPVTLPHTQNKRLLPWLPSSLHSSSRTAKPTRVVWLCYRQRGLRVHWTYKNTLVLQNCTIDMASPQAFPTNPAWNTAMLSTNLLDLHYLCFLLGNLM